MNYQTHNKKEAYNLDSNIHPKSILRNKNTAVSQLQKFLSFSKPISATTQPVVAQGKHPFQTQGASKNQNNLNQTALSYPSKIKRNILSQQASSFTPKNNQRCGGLQELERLQRQERQAETLKGTTQSPAGHRLKKTYTLIDKQTSGIGNIPDSCDLSQQSLRDKQKYQFRKKPAASQYIKLTANEDSIIKKSPLISNNTSIVGRAISPNSKVRLRDYLFMMNTSVSAAYKKKIEDIKQTKQISLDLDPMERDRTLQICRSNQSIDITNRYHTQKYRVNKKELQAVLKKEINDEMYKLRNHLDESNSILQNLNDINEENIPSWHQLRRMMTEANKKIGEALINLKSVTSTSQSIVLEKTYRISTKQSQPIVNV